MPPVRVATAFRSQWSLTFEVRKRGSPRRPPEGHSAGSQWSLTFEVRKRSARGIRMVTVSPVAMEPDL